MPDSIPLTTAVQTDDEIVFTSEAIQRVLAQAHLAAPTHASILLLGETGVGKDLFAQSIHEASPRRHRPMIHVSCGAIPTTLIESELFGHERGAFTEATSRQIGRFEAANGSTLYLDEVGELPLEVQPKLLRVLQERTVERLGSAVSVKVDVRIVAATNRDIARDVTKGTFRRDLFYRLNVFPIVIPPLRERMEDISALAWTFIRELSQRYGKNIKAISPDSIVELQQHDWPGNVRELRNVIERAMILADGPTLTLTLQE